MAVALGAHIQGLCGRVIKYKSSHHATEHAPDTCANCIARMDWALSVGVKQTRARGWIALPCSDDRTRVKRLKRSKGRGRPLWGFNLRSFNALARLAALETIKP